MVVDYSVVETVLMHYADKVICDGLIVSSKILIGKSMGKDLRDGYWEAKRSGELIVGPCMI